MRASLVPCLMATIVGASASGELVFGPDWKEGAGGSGDAGSLPASAQVPTTPLPFPATLRTIAGQLGASFLAGGADQQDVYAIYIESPLLFMATTDATVDTLGATSFDSQLFLFDSAGLPVVGHDGIGDGATVALPTLSYGPGIYYIAISIFNSDPLDASLAPIFPDLTGPQVLPSSASVPFFWTASSMDGGSYTIALTGAVFIPAPAGPLLVLAALHRRRRRAPA